MWSRMGRWLATGLALVLIVEVFGCGVAAASNPGNNGRLAYTGETDATEDSGGTFLEIYTMNPDASDTRRLTFDGGFVTRNRGWGDTFVTSHNRHPAWSPAGDVIAYAHIEGGGATIRLMDPEGRYIRSLPYDFDTVTGISWSTDGTQLAVRATDLVESSDYRVGIWVVDVDGDEQRLLISQVIPGYKDLDDPVPILIGWNVEWSPAGDSIAFEMEVDGATRVHLMDPDGSNVRPIACGWETDEYAKAFSGSPEWHPNGQLLFCDSSFTDSVYFFGPDLWIHDFRDGLNHGPFSAGLAEELSHPLVSPDGTQLLFIGKQGEEYGLWSYERAERIADDPGSDIDWQPLQGTFWDDEQSVFWPDIEWMAEEGVTKGCNPPVNDKYCPDGAVTRGQMAAFLVRALGLTDRLDNSFIDDDESVFEADIEKLAAAGITRGCNPPANDRFCPDAKVTRDQMAAFLVRSLGYTDNGGGDLFTDDNDSIFEADIDRLGTAGVTRGCNPPVNDRYCPNGNVTRGQMAAFLHRALG